MAHVVADILREAAGLNADDPRRRGATVHLDRGRPVLVAGDIHGSRQALTKTIAAAGRTPGSRDLLVLQEIIHGPADPVSGHDRSIELLLRAARLKISHPQDVLFVLGNHDIAQVAGNEISKGGCGSCKAFSAGVAFAYGDDAQEVSQAVNEFLMSLPLAIRCPGGVLISHSLPSPGRANARCLAALDRPYTLDDIRRGQGVYEWTWGRRHTPEFLEELAETLGVAFFVTGHQHCLSGCELIGSRYVTLASDSLQGCVLRFDTGQALSAADIPAARRRIAALE